eukprot:TRINITY_DN1811_c0_g1_i1.p1 TRINITY_DN1811_c0_g1~~TRINITY_DN1811_c0_g1_i1.p1  ORF type:complete len:189 (-),score=30.06 TRINITY_DN1811_c0_g1_i1:159-725(-)
MPVFDLVVSADFENIYSWQPAPGSFRWYLKIKCGRCGDVSDEFSYIDPENVEEMNGGRGQTNFQRKCKGCANQGTVNVVGGGKVTGSGVDCILATFECRGCELDSWTPQGEGVWTVNATMPSDDDDGGEAREGPLVMDVTIEDGEWCGYEEGTAQSLMISNIVHSFQVSKRSAKDLSKMERTKAGKKG